MATENALLVLKLVRITAQANKQNAEYISKSELVKTGITLLCVPIPTTDVDSRSKIIINIQQELYQILLALTMYGIEASIFDEYRTEFIQRLKESVVTLSTLITKEVL
jgi:frataxin-like iron-binding protein CyaY